MNVLFHGIIKLGNQMVLVVAAVLVGGLFGAPAWAAAACFDFYSTAGLFSTCTLAPGAYRIVASGAQGGSTLAHVGGRGAQIGGNFIFAQASDIDILVGGLGGSTETSGGGGGGSFVVTATGTPLVIAGGGGGGGGGGGNHGVVGTSGERGGGSHGGAAGVNGGGGGGGVAGGSRSVGNGGGGFKGNGDAGINGGSGGLSFSAGGTGGIGAHVVFISGAGGIGGGGGGGPGCCALFNPPDFTGGGGGGGGYSGGGGGPNAGGGGSFLDPLATDTIWVGGINSLHLGDGEVTITLLSSAVPVPAAMGLFGSGLAGLFAVVRRRRFLAERGAPIR